MNTRLALPVLLALMSSLALAEETPVVERRMNEVSVVAGYQPGPGLWRVSKGDHELWVLATVSPLPKRMQWSADEVREVIAESTAVIAPPNVAFDFDRGTFGLLMLLPTAMGARKNPDKETLADQMSPELYQRWLVQKQKYMGRDRGVEKFRPLFAANELFEAVMDEEDLSGKPVVMPLVEKAAKKADIEITEPVVKIKIDDTKGKLKAFRDSELEDVACFESTLDLVEHELPVLKARANAWAMGDVATLKTMSLAERASACTNALLGSSIMKDSGLTDLEDKIAAEWQTKAIEVLGKHRSSFGVLGLRQVIDPSRYLSALASQGYRVEAPGESIEEAETPETTPDVAVE